ncbi:hypothetical protein DFJ63DRAFT_334973 [Scheffersomyces coipomensis]|uniref:uncharacterized protein n=1 Tax=Scheffersomyces coipomensis TaxID=1788519 RepID=UPI00315C959F
MVPEVSSADLYLCNTKANSKARVTYDGMKPSFYSHSSIDFNSQFIDRKGLGNSKHILQVLEEDPDFEEFLNKRTDPIQSFLGDKFPLSLNEKLSIMCGLTNLELDFDNGDETSSRQNNFSTSKVSYETDTLRVLGRSFISLNVKLQTVYMDERYLSSPSGDLAEELDLFHNSDIVVTEFMKRNLLYKAVLPFKGVSRLGPRYRMQFGDMREKILDATSVGSFYTMVGLLCKKFKKEDIQEEILMGKIINGNLGLIQLAVELYKDKS